MKTKNRLAVVLPIACLLALGTLAVHYEALAASDDQEMLPIILAGCRTAAEAIQSGKGVIMESIVNRKSSDGGLMETETKFDLVFRGDQYKYTSELKYLKNELGPKAGDRDPKLLIQPGTKRSKSVSWDGNKVTRVEAEGSVDAFVGERYSRSGKLVHAEYSCDLMLRRSCVFDLEKYVELSPASKLKKMNPRIVGRENLDGNECVIVEIIYYADYENFGRSTNTYWFWVNPAKGYMVPRVRHWGQGPVVHKEKTLLSEVNSEMKQYADGVWGPSRVVKDLFRVDPDTGQSYVEWHKVITFNPSFEINVEVSDADLSLALPPGTTVYDETLDAQYKIP